MRGYARDAGRDPAEIGIESWSVFGHRSPDDWLEWIAAWKDLGATHLTLNTMHSGFSNPAEHIDAIRRFKEAYDSR